MGHPEAGMKKNRKLDGRLFEAMSDAEKAKVIAGIEAQTPEQRRVKERPLNKKERARFESIRKEIVTKRKAGRPTVGKGSKMVAVTIEKDLLQRADAYAKAHGLKRTELIAKALRIVIGDGRSAA